MPTENPGSTGGVEPTVQFSCLGASPTIITTTPLVIGAEVRCDEAVATVESISPGKEGRVDFVLQGPHPGAFGQSFTVSDSEGFVCQAGVGSEAGQAVLPGQKAEFFIEFQCSRGPAATLILNGTALEFPD